MAFNRALGGIVGDTEQPVERLEESCVKVVAVERKGNVQTVGTDADVGFDRGARAGQRRTQNRAHRAEGRRKSGIQRIRDLRVQLPSVLRVSFHRGPVDVRARGNIVRTNNRAVVRPVGAGGLGRGGTVLAPEGNVLFVLTERHLRPARCAVAEAGGGVHRGDDVRVVIRQMGAVVEHVPADLVVAAVAGTEQVRRDRKAAAENTGKTLHVDVGNGDVDRVCVRPDAVGDHAADCGIDRLKEGVDQLAVVEHIHDQVDQEFAQILDVVADRDRLVLVRGGIEEGIGLLPFAEHALLLRLARCGIDDRFAGHGIGDVHHDQGVEDRTDVVGNEHRVKVGDRAVEQGTDLRVGCAVRIVRQTDRVDRVRNGRNADTVHGRPPAVGLLADAADAEEVFLDLDIRAGAAAASADQLAQTRFEVVGLRVSRTGGVIEILQLALCRLAGSGDVVRRIAQPGEQVRRGHFEVAVGFDDRLEGIVLHARAAARVVIAVDNDVELVIKTHQRRLRDQVIVFGIDGEVLVGIGEVFRLGQTVTVDQRIERAAFGVGSVLKIQRFSVQIPELAVDLLQVRVGLAREDRGLHISVHLRLGQISACARRVDARGVDLRFERFIELFGDTRKLAFLILIGTEGRLDVVECAVAEHVGIDVRDHRVRSGNEIHDLVIVGDAVFVAVKRVVVPRFHLFFVRVVVGRQLFIDEHDERVGVFLRVLLRDVHLRFRERGADGRVGVNPKVRVDRALLGALVIEAVRHIGKDQLKDVVELIVFLIFKIEADRDESFVIVQLLRARIGRGVLSHDRIQLRSIVRRIRLVNRAHQTALDPFVGLRPGLADGRRDIVVPKGFVARRR